MSPQRADHADQPAHEIEGHDRGLEFDLQTLSRRGALAFLGTGLLAVAGCSSAAKVTSAGRCTPANANANATAAGKIVVTSQLALPAEACAKVYATSGYSRASPAWPAPR